MIEMPIAYKDIIIDGKEAKAIVFSDFSCEFCDQVFTNDVLANAIFLYGAFVLLGKTEGYFGFNCPKCLKTQLLKTHPTELELFFISHTDDHLFGLATGSFPLSLRYHSTGFAFPEDDKELQEYGIRSINKDSFFGHSQIPLSPDHLHSDPFGKTDYIGLSTSNWIIPNEVVPLIVEKENKEQKRIIPRFIVSHEIYDEIDRFCWDYLLHLKFVEGHLNNSKRNAEQFIKSEDYQKVKDNPEELEKFKEAHPGILGEQFLIAEMIDDLKAKISQNSIHIPSDFSSLLTKLPSKFELSIVNDPVFKEYYCKLHPFKDKGVPNNFNQYIDVLSGMKPLSDNLSETKTNRIEEDFLDFFHKGYGKKYLNDHYMDFINEYEKLLKTACFSYAAVELLRKKYLKMAHEAMKIECASDQRYAIFCTGPTWTVIFDGKKYQGMKSNGFEYIHYLVGQKRKQYTVVEIDKYLQIGIKTERKGQKDKILDEKTIADYKNRLKEITPSLEDEDPIIQKEAQKEYDFIVSELEKNVGKNGKAKKFRDQTDRIKSRITKSIERALKELKKHDEKAFIHFKDAFKSINSSDQCYNPREDFDWHLG